MLGFARLNSATFFFSWPMKVGEPHCMSQYFRTTLPFLSDPCPWVEPSPPPPPPHAAAIRDRDARVAASVRRRRRVVLAMVNSLEGAGREVFAGGSPRRRCGAVRGLGEGGCGGARSQSWSGGGERLSCRLAPGSPVGHR